MSREIMLRRIRRALGDPEGRPDVEVPRDYRRAADLTGDALVAHFAERVDDYRATVSRARSEDLAHHLAALMRDADARRVLVPAGLESRWLENLGEHVEVVADPPNLATADLDSCEVVVTAAAIGIADTGTIVLDGSPDQGRRALTLVPDHHVCVVREDQIVHTVPEAIARLEATRPLTWISGPSATSDIELDRVEGVHGPRTLDVIIVAS